MCGIAGFVEAGARLTSEERLSAIQQMAATLKHRGPDGGGVWFDPESGVALGHRRLSIIDLSPAGHQPMVSACGRYILTFNGEIYNYQEIREELDKKPNGSDGEDGRCWRGHSDTEVMLASFVEWGVKSSLERFNGMFAFALWDRRDRVLYLARDRVGKKPLYYGFSGRVFLFGSELKALRANPAWKGEIDRNALALFMRYGYIPAPHSIYRGVQKLPPGTYLSVNAKTLQGQSLPEPVPYWSAWEVVERGQRQSFHGSVQEATEELDKLLRSAVRLRMIADVPLGVLLSGGIDSSLVTALMQAQSNRPVKTFTVGFHEREFNEAERARQVASYLGTDHTELTVTPEEALAVIPDLSTMFDEPFADSSQIPTHLICRLARKHVTVALGGDGGDELFCGYNRFFKLRSNWKLLHALPTGLRGVLGQALMALPATIWDRTGPSLRRLLPTAVARHLCPEDIPSALSVISSGQAGSLYRYMVSIWKHPQAILRKGKEPPVSFFNGTAPPPCSELVHQAMYWDLVSFLPEDILTKVDRASMAVGLEVRAPLLDRRVVEFAWTLPLAFKETNGTGKRLLRELLDRYVPLALVERPKKGFSIPIDDWLRSPRLRDWAEALLDESRLREEGFFHPIPIRRRWLEHLSGRQDWGFCLWAVLMFESWLRTSYETKGSLECAP